MSPRRLLQEGLEFHKLSLTELKVTKLITLIDLLEKWNKVYNLTAVRNRSGMVTRHLLDSLSALNYIQSANSIADLGSGGGFPGLPLAIAEPNKQFTLMDSNQKKTRFLVQAKTELNLDNVEVLHTRIEQYKPVKVFDCLISRAFASPQETMSLAVHLLKPGGLLVLMMAHVDKSSINKLDNFALLKHVPVQIYNEQTTRNVVTFVKIEEN